MQELILLFNVKDKSQETAIQMISYLTKIPLRVIPKEKYGMPLKELVKDKIPTPEIPNKEELDGQMIVFAGLLDRNLNRFLYFMKENTECGKIPYKAVVTKTNQKWNAFELLAELKKEHSAVHRHKGNEKRNEKK